MYILRDFGIAHPEMINDLCLSLDFLSRIQDLHSDYLFEIHPQILFVYNHWIQNTSVRQSITNDSEQFSVRFMSILDYGSNIIHSIIHDYQQQLIEDSSSPSVFSTLNTIASSSVNSISFGIFL